ncbi:MAG: TetR family transcriptional regulator [Burkholderiales bacterium]|nr:TetR family transcriptional regulator [Burkholderiales bacterium]
MKPQTPARPSRRREKSGGGADSDQTRSTVLSVAIQEFASKGLAGARVDEIARAAQVNQQALYYYFGSKDGLFAAALEQGYRRILESNIQLANAIAELPPKEAIEFLVGKFFDRLVERREMVALIQDENRYGGIHLKNRELVRSSTVPLVQALDRILDEGAKTGAFSSRYTAEELYVNILSLCMFYFTDAHTLSVLLGKALLDPQEIQSRREQVIVFVLRALGA